MSTMLPPGTLFYDLDGRLVPREEAVQTCVRHAEAALHWRYRIKRLWRGLTSKIWEPTAEQLYSRAQWLETL